MGGQLVVTFVVVAAICWLAQPAGGAGGDFARVKSEDRLGHASLVDARGPRGIAKHPRVQVGLCITGGALCGWWLAAAVGAVVGLVGGLALARWVSRAETGAVRREAEEMARAVPLAADLLAACAAAGRPASDSLPVVARATGGSLEKSLNQVAARVALGANPVVEWTRLSTSPPLAALSRTVVRSLRSGAPLAAGLSRLADDSRRAIRADLQVRARSVGVKAAAPLALCFLPSFMLIGVVPTVAGAFTNLFGS